MKPATATSPPWSPAHLLAFRFFFVYWLLYLFPGPLAALPGTDWLTALVADGWNALVPWFGHHVLGIEDPINTFQTGSGDRLFDYLAALLTVSISLAGAGFWSLLDRKRSNYDRLVDGHWIWVRYGLGVILITYGMIKIIKLQFPYPTDGRLIEPIGESSPMGLLWTFMGYSTPYNSFVGTAEALAGFLLFFRRTTVLGACLAVGVMLNVVLLNFCYDVPVKLFSSHLLLMAVYLLVPHGRRLLACFLSYQPVPARARRRPYVWRRLERARPIVTGLFIAWLMYDQTSSLLAMKDSARASQANLVLAGLYHVEEAAKDGRDRPPLTTDEDRWHLVAFSVYKGGGSCLVRRMDGTMEYYWSTIDLEAKTLTLRERAPGTRTLELTYRRLDGDSLHLQGEAEGHPMSFGLRRTERSFPLSERRFRWIQEAPYNR